MMRDVVIDLRTPPVAEVAVGPAKAGWWPWVAGVPTLAFIVAGVLLYNATRPAPPRPLMRLNVEIARHPVGQGRRRRQRGRKHARHFSRRRAPGTLAARRGWQSAPPHTPAESEPGCAAGWHENAHGPFFSPEGEWIGFFAEGKLKKFSVEGGAAVTLCDAPVGIGASWGDDGVIIAALSNTVALSRVPSAGGTPEPVTKLNAGEVSHRWPQVLPGSQTVLFTVATQIGAGYDDANIDAISLKTGDRKTVQRGGFYPRHLAGAARTGAATWFTCTSPPFSPCLRPRPSGFLRRSGAHSGGCQQHPGGGRGFCVHPGRNIRLPLREGLAAGVANFLGGSRWRHTASARAARQYYYPRFSPDGRRLAFSMNNGKGQDIWVKDLNQDAPSRLSFLPGTSSHPYGLPTGGTSCSDPSTRLPPGCTGSRSDGSGEAKRLTEGRTLEYPSSFSPDGKRLAIFQAGNGGSFDIFTMPVEADPGPGAPGFRLGKAKVFLGTPFLEVYPAFSPDGRWLAYASNESGTQELYARPFPGPGGRWQVSTDGGRLPLWSRNGRELLFPEPGPALNGRRQYRERRFVRAREAPGMDGDSPAECLLRPQLRSCSGRQAPGGDGRQRCEWREAAHPPDVLLNFFDELRRKVPTGK